MLLPWRADTSRSGHPTLSNPGILFQSGFSDCRNILVRMIAVTVLVLVASALGLLLLLLKQRHSYWKSRKVPGPPPSLPFGNCSRSLLGRRAVYEDFAAVYREYKHEPYVGIYYVHTPILQLHDLDIIKEVFIKEFFDFNGRAMYSDPEQDAFSGHLFILSGQAWRNLRVKLSPAFTSGKVKHMFTRVEECALNLRDHVELKTAGGPYEEDVRELLARYSTDIISSLIFGLESDSINEPNSEFRLMGKRAFDPSFSVGMRFNLLFFARDIMRRLKINTQSSEVIQFFGRLVAETIAYREQNGVERADLLNLLIQLKNKGFVAPDSNSGERNVAAGTGDERTVQKLGIGQVIAQVFLFYLAGFETTSSTASWTLYELAKNPEVLEKLLKEVDTVLEQHSGKITYEAVMSVPYMEKVISETLRLYPPVQFLTREVMRTRTLPRTDLTLEKGTTINVPVNAIHRDPELWPNPDCFDPERFSDQNKSSRHPMAFIPFGEGPRICIGMRLGQVQVKAALLAVLSQFSVSRSANTPDTAKILPWAIVPTPTGGLPVTFNRRNKPNA